MKHFPLFLNLSQQRVVVAGGGETALAKLRLLLKTQAGIQVFAPNPVPAVRDMASKGLLNLQLRSLLPSDLTRVLLVYAAQDDAAADAQVAEMGRKAGALVNIVDNLDDSDFITPAIVDRDPVTIAIGTEGTAPVLARQIKAQIEETLPSRLGILARLAEKSRAGVEALPKGRVRRAFWAKFFFERGPLALANNGAKGAARALSALLEETISQKPLPAKFDLIGIGPGDPELMTLAARKALHDADVVIHDTNISKGILELARREARLVPCMLAFCIPQERAKLLAGLAAANRHVVWLQQGDAESLAPTGHSFESLAQLGFQCSILRGVPEQNNQRGTEVKADFTYPKPNLQSQARHI